MSLPPLHGFCPLSNLGLPCVSWIRVLHLLRRCTHLHRLLIFSRQLLIRQLASVPANLIPLQREQLIHLFQRETGGLGDCQPSP